MMYHFLKNMTSKTTLYTYLTYFPFCGFDVLFFFSSEQNVLQDLVLPRANFVTRNQCFNQKKEGPQHYENKRIWNF